MADFEPFPKIGRHSGGRMVISEKIDGTNAQIFVPEDDSEPVLVGSRSRWITPGKNTDNFGFAGWVYERADALRTLLGPGRHFGEWWGHGIQRCYNLKERRFSLFNTLRWCPENSSMPGLAELDIYAVPVLYDGPVAPDAVDMAMHALAANGSAAAHGFQNPEGIIVFHCATKALSKKTFENDIGKWAEVAA